MRLAREHARRQERHRHTSLGRQPDRGPVPDAGKAPARPARGRADPRSGICLYLLGEEGSSIRVLLIRNRDASASAARVTLGDAYDSLRELQKGPRKVSSSCALGNSVQQGAALKANPRCIRPSRGQDASEVCERCRSLSRACSTVRRRVGRQPGVKNRKRKHPTGHDEVTNVPHPLNSLSLGHNHHDSQPEQSTG